MRTQELTDYIRAKLADSTRGDFIDTKFWIEDCSGRYPEVPQAEIARILRSEAGKAGINAP